MTDAFAGDSTAYGARLDTLEHAVGPLETAAAFAGVRLARVDDHIRAAAVIAADSACRLGRCTLENAHRAPEDVRLLLSQALYLLGGEVGEPVTASEASGYGERVFWEEYFQQAAAWCQNAGTDPCAVLHLVADCMRTTGSGKLAVYADVAGDVGDSWDHFNKP